ncbi:hypothetical protein J6590_002180 [Homalodisca vitripennis]|nr:hypothetical protein J6590_002180 [Homalodisca vitripennis]
MLDETEIEEVYSTKFIGILSDYFLRKLSECCLTRSIVTISNVKWAISKFSPFTSPGEGEIFPALLLSRIEESLVVKGIALCTFLDIERAFDNMLNKAMICGIPSCNANQAFCKWISAMLSFRHGNKLADKLARNGLKKHFLGPELAYGISESTAYEAIRKWFKDKHCHRWQRLSGQPFGKKLIRGTNIQFMNWLTKLNIDLLIQVISLLLDTANAIIILDFKKLEVRRTLFVTSQPGDEINVSIGQKLLDLVEGTGVGRPY